MSESSLRIIVTGLIAQFPLGGVAWDYGQYPLGLRRLGHDVYYIEDTGQWPYNPQEGGLGSDPTFNVEYLAKIMTRLGLEDRWAYRFPWESQWFGMPDTKREKIIESADLLINVSGTLARPREYRDVKRIVYLDSDPVFTQVKLARGQEDFRKIVDAHDIHFSFGECFSESVPDTGHQWLPTRQPIVLSEWEQAPAASHRNAFTTIMTWASYNPTEFEGKKYGQKDMEFKRFLDLPGMVTPTILEIALNPGKVGKAPLSLLTHKGWQIVDPAELCPDLDSYRTYIQRSKAEWSVAKHGYVQGQAGWFSCRSACYLAAGRPVILQETGFSEVLPIGEGLFSFRTLEEAVAAIQELERDYARHSEAAMSIAKSYFDSDLVLSSLIERAMGG
ncbi:MAG: hypothetical protein WA996_09975 [Candidatus Promineifilaceae bacterium]